MDLGIACKLAYQQPDAHWLAERLRPRWWTASVRWNSTRWGYSTVVSLDYNQYGLCLLITDIDWWVSEELRAAD